MNVRALAIMLLVVSFLLTVIVTPSFSGHVIAEQIASVKPVLYLVTIAFIAASFFIFAYRKTLDVLLIPTEASSNRMRNKAQVAAKWAKQNHPRVIVASGGEMPFLEKPYKSEAALIVDELRKSGVRSHNVYVEDRSRDNVDNVMMTLKKLYEHGEIVRDIGIVSYPHHLDRFEKIIAEGQKNHVIDSHIRVHRIETDETVTERLWEIPARVATDYRLRKGLGQTNSHVGLGKKALYFLAKLFQGDYFSSPRRRS